MKNPNSYQPGVCNIGAEERAFRLQLGLIWSVLTIILVALIILFDLNTFFNLLVLPFSFLGAIGIIQARFKFCAYYGMAGVYNFTKSLITRSETTKKENIKKDRGTALKIIAMSTIVAACITFVSFILSYYL